LLSISRGTDRNGRMAARDGDRLRAQMFAAAESSGDHGSCAALYADAGKQAAKQNDAEGALEWWRRAVAIGCTEPQVVDRVTTGMLQAGDYGAAASALRASLARDDVARTTRDRLEKRLARCERALA
jgi:Tfp pilus assembly protein PilF